MSNKKVIEKLHEARSLADSDAIRSIIDNAITEVEAYSAFDSAAQKALWILCMTPCSRCDKIKPYLPATQKWCEKRNVEYNYSRDNAFLIKMKKRYKLGGATPMVLVLDGDGEKLNSAIPTADEISTEAKWLKFIEKTVG